VIPGTPFQILVGEGGIPGFKGPRREHYQSYRGASVLLTWADCPTRRRALLACGALLVRPANRTPPVLASILAIGPPILTAFLAIGTPVLTSILTILAPILAPLHPGRLSLGVCRCCYRGWYSHANCGPYSQHPKRPSTRDHSGFNFFTDVRPPCLRRCQRKMLSGRLVEGYYP